jgi:hypothetical protein
MYPPQNPGRPEYPQGDAPNNHSGEYSQPPQISFQSPPQISFPQQQNFGYNPMPQMQPTYRKMPMATWQVNKPLLIMMLVFFVVVFGAVGIFTSSIFSQANNLVSGIKNTTSEVRVYTGAQSLTLNDSYKSTAVGFTKLKMNVYASSDSPDKLADFYKSEFSSKGYSLTTTDRGNFAKGETRILQGFGTNGARVEVRLLNAKDIIAATPDGLKATGQTVFVVLSSNPLDGF